MSGARPDPRDGDRVVIATVEQHTDARGTVFEPVGPDALPHLRNAHVVLTEPGEIRGNHLHRHATEILVVRGPARVAWREAGEERVVDVEADAVLSFTVPPDIPHAVLNTGDRPQLLVAFRDTVHDPHDPDTYPEPIL